MNTKQPEQFLSLIERLGELVKEIEDQDVELEHSLNAFEEGITLIRHAQAFISEAEQRVNTLTESSNAPQSGD